MGNKRDDFNSQTKETLALRVSYMCSNPECAKMTAGPHENKNKHSLIGVAALIWDKDKFLICQRPANKARALL